MPLFWFKCRDCGSAKEHFVLQHSGNEIPCPGCGSQSYIKQLSRFKMNVEYADQDEFMEKRINPMVEETYEKIGKEAVQQDTKTLDDIYGKEKVEKTFYGHDN